MAAHYINNREFETVIRQYKADPGPNENRLVELFDILITNIHKGFRFRVDEDDAKQECFVLVFKSLQNFNPDDGSAFNYFTTVIVNNLRLLYSKEKTYREKLAIYTKNYIERNPILDN